MPAEKPHFVIRAGTVSGWIVIFLCAAGTAFLVYTKGVHWTNFGLLFGVVIVVEIMRELQREDE